MATVTVRVCTCKSPLVSEFKEIMGEHPKDAARLKFGRHELKTFKG